MKNKLNAQQFSWSCINLKDSSRDNIPYDTIFKENKCSKVQNSK